MLWVGKDELRIARPQTIQRCQDTVDTLADRSTLTKVSVRWLPLLNCIDLI